MNEFMGLITGAYDAKASGFSPGGASLHSCMSAHGPDDSTVQLATDTELRPHKIEQTLAFMFETRHVLRPSRAALALAQLQTDYDSCWAGLVTRFDEEQP
jgi:homogentisate 1,2-dioxygenase